MTLVFWNKLPQYSNEPQPRFSTGWLDAFKARYKIKKFRRHKESGAVDRVVVEEELSKLREDLKDVDSEDIYNMDETGLFWKTSLDGTLATEQTPGGKHEKARITANFCCNVTGTRKLKPWFIGKAKIPRCFGSSGVKADNLAMVWRANKTVWMTGVIFKEYLLWFDIQVEGRKVVLLIDGFSAHKTGLDLLLEARPTGLRNTTVIFLPANATSICQPLDQGIIRAWKAHYRKRWLSFVCSEYDADRDPIASMNVLQAVQWGIAVWEGDVTPTTIHNCWIKARVLGPKYGPMTKRIARVTGWEAEVAQDTRIYDDVLTQMDKQIKVLASKEKIKSAMNVARFLNPADEDVDDKEEDIVNVIAAAYSHEERAYETDEENVPVARVKDSEALQLLERLRLYEEQQDNRDDVLVTRLN